MNNSLDTSVTTDTKKSHIPSKWRFWKHRRYIVAVMVFFGCLINQALRANLSIAIVAMTSDRYEISKHGTIINIGPEFHWTNEIQGYVLSSYFYGYVTTQLLGGYLAQGRMGSVRPARENFGSSGPLGNSCVEVTFRLPVDRPTGKFPGLPPVPSVPDLADKYGGKIIFGTGIAVAALLTIMTPWLASANVYLMLAVRVFEGIFAGVTYPSIVAVWGKWAPTQERSFLSTISISGSNFGTVVAMLLSALLADAFGWRSIFYFFGVLGLIWYACWMFIVANSPDEDTKISPWELDYFKSSLNHGTNEEEYKLSVPWKSIFSSKAVWAICVSHFCGCWGYYTFMTQLPKYLKDIYILDLGDSGFLLALPYLFLGIGTQITGKLADIVISRGYLTVQQTRKSFNFISHTSQFSFVMLAALATNQNIVVFSLSMGVVVGALVNTGVMANPLDIAPQYASIIFGLSNICGTISGMISPIFSGYIVSDDPTISEWQIIFYVTSGMSIVGAFFYVTFASGEVQSWAKN